LRKNLGSKIATIFIIAICLYALLQLLLMRYSSGDVYPKYSSLRTDPFGTKALYESLQDCCGLKTSRNFDEFYKIRERSESALIFAGSGIPPDEIPASFFNDLDAYMKHGGRLIVTYVPSGTIEIILKEIEEENKKQQEKEEKEKKKQEKKKDAQKTREEELFRTVKLSERWGLKYKEFPNSKIGSARLATKTRLPKVLTWHSPVYFELVGKEWNVIYRREGRAVVTERRIGRGSLVLVSDTFLLSNEAMLRDRQPEFLAWMIGGKKEVIFDEYHHGIATRPGVAALARKYRLHGIAAGLLIMAFLFVWMNSTSLVPKYTGPAELKRKTITGKDTASGLSNLLRRSVSMKDILTLCFSEWKKSVGKEKQRDTRLKKAQEYLTQVSDETNRVKDPVASYNRISQILNER
jgi:hypothetical protein